MSDERKVKAVFSDVDGTLLNSAHRVTPRTGEWIHTILDKDIPFVIVSARSPSGIYPIMKRNGFECALISYSGALIMDRGRTVLYSKEIERGLSERIEQFFVNKAYDMSCPRILREESIVEAQSREGHVKDLPPGKGVNKFLCICAPGTILKIEEEVKNAFPEVEVVKSSDILLEIMAKGISKAEAVKHFCEHLGISPEDTIAFGDNFNDAEMLEAVGRGYVMGNAPEEILNRFPYHTADNDHDGIADVLEQYFESDSNREITG